MTAQVAAAIHLLETLARQQIAYVRGLVVAMLQQQPAAGQQVPGRVLDDLVRGHRADGYGRGVCRREPAS